MVGGLSISQAFLRRRRRRRRRRWSLSTLVASEAVRGSKVDSLCSRLPETSEFTYLRTEYRQSGPVEAILPWDDDDRRRDG